MFSKLFKAFTIIEALTVITILGILLAVATTSYQTLIERKRLKSATETLYGDLKFIRSESMKRQADLYVSFQAGANWCYGVDDTAACDCGTANDCQIDGAEKVVRSTDYREVSMALTGFTTAGGNRYIQFEGIRGVASDSGSVTFSLNAKTVVLSTNKMGLVQTCSNKLVSYNACP